jgi:ketosteroid isomerase-like protein
LHEIKFWRPAPFSVGRILTTLLQVILVLATFSGAEDASAKDDALPPDLAKAAAEYDQAQMKNDGAALHRLLADDYALVNGSDEIADKAAFIKDSTQPGWALQPFVVTNAINRVWADGAVLSGEVELKGTSDGKAFDVRMRFADVWRKRDGKWQVVFTEVTRFPIAKPS